MKEVKQTELPDISGGDAQGSGPFTVHLPSPDDGYPKNPGVLLPVFDESPGGCDPEP
jgi:hypothetical protein